MWLRITEPIRIPDNVRIDGRVFNVREFGAVGDGITDDTAAVQAAVDAAERAQNERTQR